MQLYYTICYIITSPNSDFNIDLFEDLLFQCFHIKLTPY
uniref:Uncharacterized protein n=1 Tax=Anguilla anguilla TaxID=7936 RepID=A0A0E9WK17_ANGAN